MDIDALVKACELGNEGDTVRALSLGLDINGRDREGWTALNAAISFGHSTLADLLLARGATVQCSNADGDTPLHRAAYRGDLSLARLLVDRGANVNAKNADGHVPLNWALTNRKSTSHIDIVRLLLANGADVYVKGPLARTPLHQAASNNNVPGATLLLEYGADVRTPDVNGATPLDLHRDEDRGNDGDAMEVLLLAAGDNKSSVHDRTSMKNELELRSALFSSMDSSDYLYEAMSLFESILDCPADPTLEEIETAYSAIGRSILTAGTISEGAAQLSDAHEILIRWRAGEVFP